MAETKTRKIRGFGRVVLIYTVVLLAIILLGLAVFYAYIYRYEYSRPKSAITRYMDTLDSEEIEKLSGDYLNSLDGNVQNKDEVAQFINDAVNEASYLEKRAESTEELSVYTVKYDGKTFGRLELTPKKKDLFGFTPMEVKNAEFDFASLGSNREIVVPAGYTVECNGRKLDDSYITDDSIRYELLEDFYDGEVTMPTLCRYEFGPLLDDAVVRVFDPSGYELSEEELGEDFFTDNCNIEQRHKVGDFVEVLIRRYVKYSSAVDKNNTVNYGNLVSLMVPGSELVSRMVQAIEGLGWASSRDDVLDSVTLNRCMSIGDGNYVCDVTYTVQTLGQSSDYITTTNNVRIVLVDNDGSFLAAAMTSY